MLATLGGLDALFTGGVGEKSPNRAAACADLNFCVKLDFRKMPSHTDQDISALDSTVRVLVVQARRLGDRY